MKKQIQVHYVYQLGSAGVQNHQSYQIAAFITWLVEIWLTTINADQQWKDNNIAI